MNLKSKLNTLKEKYKETKMGTTFNALRTFPYTPDEVTHGDTRIKAVDDLKRTMNVVIMALVPCLVFGIFNAGYQHQVVFGTTEPQAGMVFCNGNFWGWVNLSIGIAKILPLVIVSYVVSLGIEFIFATICKHEVEEGYLVIGMLVLLIIPIDIPLWMLIVVVAFGVIIGKGVFGGTGMNILNPALTIRAFLFFAYPTPMTGDEVWVEGAVQRAKDIATGANLDTVSGETVLGNLAQGQTGVYQVSDLFFGFIPGSVGEASTLFTISAGLFLIHTKIASWRIMVSTFVGAWVMGAIFNCLAPSTEGTQFYALWNLPAYEHLLIGGLAFGAVFMATDPVAATQTNTGKYIYGLLAGFIATAVRCFNPAYLEGVMLAILLTNVLAPTIDHFVIQANVSRRKRRLKLSTTKTA